MADTSEVLSLLNENHPNTEVMVIVGNMRGGIDAASESKVKIIGFPYSVSKTFLNRNLNSTPDLAWQTVLDLKSLCEHSDKKLRVYISMAFGNPYGDEWNDEIVIREVDKLYRHGIRDVVFSDITGEGTPGSIERLCSELINSFPGATLGVHLHTKPAEWQEKLEAAWRAGIRNFESALGGVGGCPMTGFGLLANLDTYNLVEWLNKQGIPTGVNPEILLEARTMADAIFLKNFTG
jgi:hydroxymethylglutaryl-CoA lyase